MSLIQMEEKQIFAKRFSLIRKKFPNVDANSLAAQTLKWLVAAKEKYDSAPIKRGDIQNLISRCQTAGSFSEAIRLVGSIFSDPFKLGKCFPLPIDEMVECEDVEDDLWTFDWKEADQAVKLLVESNQRVMNAMGHAMRSFIVELTATCHTLKKGDGRTRAMRILMTAPQDQISRAHRLKSFLYAPKERKDALARFLFVTWGMGNSVVWLKEAVENSIENEKLAFSFGHVETVMNLLKALWELNQTLLPAQQINPETFIIEKLAEHGAKSEDYFLFQDFRQWNQTDKNAPPQSFTACPFVLDTAAKAQIIQLASDREQRESFHQAAGGGEIPFLILRVRRENLVNDTMSQLSRFSKQDLRKPLKVQFVGEEGVDAGGVRKEYFLLMMRQLLDPSFGMFIEVDPQTKLLWFNADFFENHREYELIGTLFGLAITNRVILDVPFPLVVYKLILSEDNFKDFTLEDLKELDPSLVQGLDHLLTFDGDVESVFCRTFQVSRESFGEMKYFDLVPNGASIPVTNENRDEYVRLYLNWFLVESVKPALEAFRKGLLSVIPENLLRHLLFSPKELELLVVGVRALDFKALESSASYDDGFDENSKTIKDFWKVVHSLSEKEKRTFLRFVTGSDRVPIRGLGDVKIVISKNGSDPERLPSAHTCFDHLLLPDYQDEDRLREKLIVALEHAEGFFTR